MSGHAPNRIKETGPVDGETFLREIATRYEPVVLRDQIAHWPAVEAGKRGARSIVDYVTTFGGGTPLEVVVGRPEIAGRFLLQRRHERLQFRPPEGEPAPVDAPVAGARPTRTPTSSRRSTPTRRGRRIIFRAGRTRTASTCRSTRRPGCGSATRRRSRPITIRHPISRAWWRGGGGSRCFRRSNCRTCTSARWTIRSPVPRSSMVDPCAPDLDRYPRFSTAWAAAQTAELGPGDAIFIPSIWWHHVQALDTINLLVNYWWTQAGIPAPFLALVHAMMAVRDLAPGEREAWRSWFDHLVFDDAAPHAGDHLPERAANGAGRAERGPERAHSPVSRQFVAAGRADVAILPRTVAGADTGRTVIDAGRVGHQDGSRWTATFTESGGILSVSTNA